MVRLLILVGLLVGGCSTATAAPASFATPAVVVTPALTGTPAWSQRLAPAQEPTPTSTPLPTSAPSPAPSGAPFAITNTLPLPACRYDLDLPTPLVTQESWNLTLVDALYSVPADYVPGDLVSTGPAGLGGFLIRAEALPDLRALAAAARGSGIALALVSTYRDYADQEALFRGWSARLGSDVDYGSARPGHSEHQLGLALDFTIPGALPWNFYNFERDTPAGRWLAANAWRYGFVMSYPWKGRDTVTCYGYEPWHYRYVGRAEAASVRASGLTLRQWLWLRQPMSQAPSPGGRL
jgi:D-alanyl-D-alanine carboxypeptidase